MTDVGMPPPPAPADPQEHSYNPRFWYPLSVAALGAFASLALMGLFGPSFATGLLVPVILPVVVWRQMRLTLSAVGLSVAGRALPWNRVVITSTRWGESLGSERDAPLRERVTAYLPLYQQDWRNGRIGADVQRWAPHLLASSADH